MTSAAPAAVRPQVNSVPRKACMTGPYPCIILFPFVWLMMPEKPPIPCQSRQLTHEHRLPCKREFLNISNVSCYQNMRVAPRSGEHTQFVTVYEIIKTTTVCLQLHNLHVEQRQKGSGFCLLWMCCLVIFLCNVNRLPHLKWFA